MTKLTGPTLKYHSIIKREKELIKNLNFKLFPSIARGVFSIHLATFVCPRTDTMSSFFRLKNLLFLSDATETLQEILRYGVVFIIVSQINV